MMNNSEVSFYLNGGVFLNTDLLIQMTKKIPILPGLILAITVAGFAKFLAIFLQVCNPHLLLVFHTPE